MQSQQLIQTLVEQTRLNMNQVERLKALDPNALNWRENPGSWSILECLEHLNLYGDFYLPQLEAKIRNSNTKSEAEFKPGILGDYFAKSMMPKEKLNKMKTFKDKNPLNSKLDRNVLEKFVNQQIRLLDILSEARNVSLNKVRVEISISRFIRLKLGDTLRFFINHNTRHMQQLDRIVAAMGKA